MDGWSNPFAMIRTEQNLHEIILRNFKEAVVFADAQGRIQIFNVIAEKYFQTNAKKVLGKRLERTIPYKNIKKQFDLVYETREENHDVELAAPVPSAPASGQETRILHCSFYPIFDKKGSDISGLFGNVCGCDGKRSAPEGD